MKFAEFGKGMKGAVFEFGREFFLQTLEIMPVRSSNNFSGIFHSQIKVVLGC